MRGIHLHYDIEAISLSLNVSHTYHIKQKTTDAKKKQEGVILQYHQNLSVLTYMYIGVIRITCEYFIFY